MDSELYLYSDGVLFVERTNELAVWCEVKGVITRSRSESEDE